MFVNITAMKFNINIEDQPTEINVNEGDITYILGGHRTNLLYEDVIGLEKSDEGDHSYKLYYIRQQSHNKLAKEHVTFTTDSNVFEELRKNITSKIWTVTERPKKLAVFVNSVGGDRKGKQLSDDVVVPVLSLAGIQTDVIVSQRFSHASEFAETYDFNQVDGVVIMGGDGTVSDICNVLMKDTQKEAGIDLNDPDASLKTMELPIAVIPTGTWNGIVKVMHGCKDVLTSTLHIVKGQKREGNVLGSYSGGELVGYATFCTGFALQTELTNAIIKYRWMGHFRNIIAFVWYVLIRSYREINVEITYEYFSLEKGVSQTVYVRRKEEVEKFENISDEQQVQKDEFDLIDYKMCSRPFLMDHYKRFRQILTKTYSVEAKDFINYSKVASFYFRATEDNQVTPDEIRYLYNIDGEIWKLKAPEVYVKLFPRCYTVFSSYKGPIKWSVEET